MTTFDLHVHTTASDGHFTPKEVIDKAKIMGLKAIAITDHDTTAGIAEALSTAINKDIIVIPGIELSSDYNDKEVHILGYFMDYNDTQFQDVLKIFRNDRKERADKMVRKLNKLGYEITFNDVLKYSDNGSVGRPHIAQALIAKGYINSIGEAFDKLLSREKPAYVPREKLTPHEAVKLVRKHNGIPVIAHPGIANYDTLIPELINVGLMGIEVYHPEHGLQDIIKYLTIARSHDLLVTGGSDFHGAGPQSKCNLGVPDAEFTLVQTLLKAKETLNNAIS